MNNKIVKIIVELLLLAIAGYFAWRALDNVKGTIDFGTEREAREAVAIQRLTDIQTLEKEYYTQYGVYQDTFEVLKKFYLEGAMSVSFQNGSNTDTVAFLATQKLKDSILKDYARRRITFGKGDAVRKEDSLNVSLYRDYYLKDTVKYKDLLFSVRISKPVREQIFTDRPDFCIDSLEYIPFSGGKKIVYWANEESDETGLSLAVYEVKIPYEDLLTGMDSKEVSTFCKDRLKFDHDQPKIKPVGVDTTKCPDQRPGLQIGGDYQFNNGAGNWK